MTWAWQKLCVCGHHYNSQGNEHWERMQRTMNAQDETILALNMAATLALEWFGTNGGAIQSFDVTRELRKALGIKEPKDDSTKFSDGRSITDKIRGGK